MKIIQCCPICNTREESYHEWDDLEEFYAANFDEAEFPHDERNKDCGGSLKYYIKPGT